MAICDRCDASYSVIQADAFCPDCHEDVYLCEECFAWHVKENIEELEYERSIREMRNR